MNEQCAGQKPRLWRLEMCRPPFLWIWVVHAVISTFVSLLCVWMHFEHFSTIIHSFYLMLPLIIPPLLRPAARCSPVFFAQCLYPNAFWLLVRFTHIRHLGMHWWKVVQFWNKLTQEKRGNIVQMLKVVSELINAPNEWIKWQRIGGRMLPWELCVCCSIFECHDGGELLFHMKHTVSEWF